MDLNDELGIAKDSTGQRLTVPEDEHAGNIGPREERGHTQLIRAWLQQLHFCNITSFHKTGVIFYSEFNNSEIDHLFDTARSQTACFAALHMREGNAELTVDQDEEAEGLPTTI